MGSISADANAKMFTTAHLCSIPYISALREQEATTCAYHSNLGCAYYIYTTMKGTSEAVQWKWYHKRSCHKCWRHRGMISHFCDIMSDWLSAGGIQYKSNNRQQRGHSFARIQTHHSVYRELHVHGKRQRQRTLWHHRLLWARQTLLPAQAANDKDAGSSVLGASIFKIKFHTSLDTYLALFSRPMYNCLIMSFIWKYRRVYDQLVVVCACCCTFKYPPWSISEIMTANGVIGLYRKRIFQRDEGGTIILSRSRYVVNLPKYTTGIKDDKK